MRNSTQPANHGETDADVQLAEVLVHYESMLLGSATVEHPFSNGLDPATQGRFDRARAVLELLTEVAPGYRGLSSGRTPPGNDAREFAHLAMPWPTPGPLPSEFGRFQILRELGRGGFGVVYLAHDPVLRRQVALKIPRMDAILTAKPRERFLREARAAARLNHPHIAIVYEVGEIGPFPYMAGAYYEGGNLAQRIQDSSQPISPAEAAGIVAALADAVHYAHTQGVLHRDIKPSNILLEVAPDSEEVSSPSTRANHRMGLPRLTDFGLAHVAEEGSESTKSGALIGSPAYMSPEQASGETKAISARTDVYGLGTVLYELLTGRRPFLGTSDIDTLRRVVDDTPTPPSQIKPELPRDLEAICLRCLEKKAVCRYATAGALAADLGRFLAGEPTLARPLGPLGRTVRWIQRNRWVASLGILVFSLLLLGVAVSTFAALRIAQERNIAEKSAADAREAERGLAEALAHMERAREDEKTARAAAEQSALDAQAQAKLALEEASRVKKEAATANRLSDLLSGLFQSVDPTGLGGLGIRTHGDFGRDLTSKELLERAVSSVETQDFASEDAIVRARLYARLSKTCRLAGMADVASKLSAAALAALDVAGNRPSASDRARVMQLAGFTLEDTEQYAEAERLLRLSLQNAQIAKSQGAMSELDVASIKVDLSWVLTQKLVNTVQETDQGYSEAERLMREALKTRRQLLGDSHPEVAISATLLALLLITTNNQAAASQFLFQEFTPIFAAQPGGDSFTRGVRFMVGGAALRQRHDLDGAIEQYRRAIETFAAIDNDRSVTSSFSENHPAMMLVWGEFAGACKQSGQYRDAETAIRKVIEISDRVLPQGHPRLIAPLCEYADELADRQDFEESNRILRRAVTLSRRYRNTSPSLLDDPFARIISNAVLQGDDQRATAAVDEFVSMLKDIHRDNSRVTEACLQAALSGLGGSDPNQRLVSVIGRLGEVADECYADNAPTSIANSISIHRRMAACLFAAGKPDEAQRHVDRVLAMALPRTESPLTAFQLQVLFEVMLQESEFGHPDVARSYAEQLLKEAQDNREMTAYAYTTLAWCSFAARDFTAATNQFRQAVDELKAIGDGNHRGLARAYYSLAQAQLAGGQLTECMESIRAAMPLLEVAAHAEVQPIHSSVTAVTLIGLLKVMAVRNPEQADEIDMVATTVMKDLGERLRHKISVKAVENANDIDRELRKKVVSDRKKLEPFLSAAELSVWHRSMGESAVSLLESGIALSDSHGKSFPTWRIRQELETALGRWLTDLKRFEEAEVHLLAAFSRCQTSLDERHVITSHVAKYLAELYSAWDRPADAEKFRLLWRKGDAAQASDP